MSADEYVLGLLAILSGLAITQLVASLTALLLARGQVRWDWLACAAAALVGYIIVYGWYVSWSGFHGTSDGLPFWRFVLPVLNVMLQFVAARAILPDPAAGGSVDLADHYARVAPTVWRAILGCTLIVAAGIAVRAVGGGVVGNATPLGLAGFALTVAIVLVLALPYRRGVHRLLVPGFAALFVAATIFRTL